MKNSSGAIGAAKAPPYLVSHRRIINVIRIMYPRNLSDQQGCGERTEGGMGNCGGRDAYLCCGIYRGGTSRWKGKEEMERRGRRCVYKGNADGALTIVHPNRGVYSPSSIPQPRSLRCDAKPMYFAFVAFCAHSKKRIRQYSRESSTNRNFRQDTNADGSKMQKKLKLKKILKNSHLHGLELILLSRD